MRHPKNGSQGSKKCPECKSVGVAKKSLAPIGEGLWRFSLQMGAFIVNGFTYNERNRQILKPSCNWGKGRKEIVRVRGGIHINRLRDAIEKAIEEGNAWQLKQR